MSTHKNDGVKMTIKGSACHNEPEETATHAHMAKDFWFGRERN
jgi:hypothetical protein